MKTFNFKRAVTLTAIAVCSFMAVGNAYAGNNATEKKKTKELYIHFTYNKQQGPGSNQYAVWIEDMKGNVVKTLFVTSFTTKGRARAGQQADRGYHYRPTCVPTWVKHANAEAMSDTEIDGFTGATPKVERCEPRFVWDLTDENGKPLKEGTYKFFVEGTYYNNSIVLYEGEFNTKEVISIKKSEVQPTQEHANMIEGVGAEVRNKTKKHLI